MTPPCSGLRIQDRNHHNVRPGWSASTSASIERSWPATACRAWGLMNGSLSCTGGQRGSRVRWSVA